MNFRGNNCVARDGNARVCTRHKYRRTELRESPVDVCICMYLQYVHFEIDWGKILAELNFEVDCDILSSQKEIFMSSRNSANCV